MKRENTTLYAIKAVACFSIVSLHFLLPGDFGDFYQIIARFAVPFFLMLSGYYSLGISREKVARRLRQMLALTAGSLAFYGLVHLVHLLVTDGLAAKWAGLTWTDLLDFLVFNSPKGLLGSASTPVWYLLAISYIYGLYLVFYKSFQRWATLRTAFVLLGLAFVVEYFTGNEFHYRNFLFMGLPFYILGLQFARYQEQILAYRLSLAQKWGLVLGTAGLVLLEYRLIGTDYDLYPSTIVMASAVFLYAIRNADRVNIPLLNSLAKHYATMIYIIHPFIIFLFRNLMPRNEIYSFGLFIIFPLSCLLSISVQKYIKPLVLGSAQAA